MKSKINARLVGMAVLWMVLSAFGNKLRAQVTVTVPGACNVVVAGSGGTTGFGGTVGSGGIVVMPDPFPTPGGTFTVNPAGNTILGWGLLGDLSVNNASLAPPLPPIQTVGAGVLSSALMSYNKFLRPSEQAFPSLPTLARSKARVSVAYTNPSASCNGTIQFDIYKEYANTGVDSTYVPPIIGPDCWLPSEVYTYSVDQIASDNYGDAIGGDEYYWTIIDNNNVDVTSLAYTSADKSSITLQTPSTLAAPYTITCCFGRANPWDGNNPLTVHTTCVTKIVGGQPTPPVFSTAIPVCLQTGLTSFNASVNPVLGYLYTWEASNNSWLLSSSGGQGENLSVSSMGDEPGTITLTITYAGCEPVEYVYRVGREYVSPLAILGATCVAAGGSYPYTIPTSALNNTTGWSVPPGWTVTPTNGAGSMMDLGIPAGTAAGAYTISAYSDSCPSGIINLTVNVKPEKPIITSGPSCVVRNGGSAELFTATSSSGATGYLWNMPVGWTCFSCTTTTAIVVAGGTGTGPEYITMIAYGTNGCNDTSDEHEVNYYPVTPSGISVGCFNFGINGNTSVTVGNAPAAFFGDYDVVDPSGVLLTGFTVNPLTGAITLHTSGAAPAGTYTLQVRHETDSCGVSPYVNFNVTFGGNGAMIGHVFNPGMGNSDLYYVLGAPSSPPSTYQWFVDSVPAGTGSTLTLSNNPPGPGQVCVNVTHNGCITRLCTPGGSHSRMASIDNGEVTVYPNPNDGHFTVRIPKFNTSASARLLDMTGKEVGTFRLAEGDNRISKENLAAGTYCLFLEMDGEVSTHKVQILGK